MKPIVLDSGAWRGYRMAAFPDRSWSVEGGVLHALAPRRGRQFGRPLPRRRGGGSALAKRAGDAASRRRRPPDGRVPETRCGALYGLYRPEIEARCPPGEFHLARIRVHRNRAEHWLNGVCVLRFDLESNDFHERVARSKFGRFRLFAKTLQGHLVLQHHGEEAWFRNLRLE